MKKWIFYILVLLIPIIMLLYSPISDHQSMDHTSILLPWNEPKPTQAALMIVDILESLDSNVHKINYLDPEVDSAALGEEVLVILEKIDLTEHTAEHSIPKRVFQIAKDGRYPVLQKVMIKVKAAMADKKGLLLPGGPDVHPSFYGQQPHPETGVPEDLRRDIFEFAMLEEADAKHLPVFGICRGMQVCNIWYGGTLNQHVDHHRDVLQKYTLDGAQQSDSLIARIFKDSQNMIIGESRHHQSLDRIGKNLFPVCVYEDGTIKAVEGFGKRFLVLVQWHPEVIFDLEKKHSVSPANLDFFFHFVQAAKDF